MLEKVLGEQAEVKTGNQEIRIECKNLDEVTSQEHIYDALKKLCKLSEIEQSSRKKPYGGIIIL